MRNFNFYMPPNERKGFIFLILLIITGHIFAVIYEKMFGYSDQEKLELLEEILRDYHDQKPQAILNETENSFINLAPFNPNKIDPEVLETYGVSKYASANLEKYRKAGGHIRNIEDLYKIYGMDSILIKSIKHLIIFDPGINHRRRQKDKSSSLKSIQITVDTTHFKSDKSEYFDPNIADRETLIAQGFSTFSANNLLNYIEKGGKIVRDSDVLKVYGLDTSLFEKIRENIKIEHIVIDSPNYKKQSTAFTQRNRDQKSLTTADINLSSEEDLLLVRGIGPYLSKAIVAYRERLGGYYKIDQIKEIFAFRPGSYDSIQPSLTITGDVSKIYIPDLSFKEVLSHPYIDYETTKRLKNIPLDEFDKVLNKLIQEGIIQERLVPYLHLVDPYKFIQIEK